MAGSAPRSRKLASRIQRRVRIQDVQLPAAKVSNPRFRGKERKFPRHFKGHFSIGNVQVRILRGQPSSPGGGETDWDGDERPANGGLLRIGPWSPGSGFLPFQGENAESLRPDTGIFPFSGDGDRRLGFDRHYVAGAAVGFCANSKRPWP